MISARGDDAGDESAVIHTGNPGVGEFDAHARTANPSLLREINLP